MSIGDPQYETLTGFSPPSTLGPYRAQDYWQLPEGEPVELMKGRFVVSPSPGSLHQTVILFLAKKFLDFAIATGGRAFVAPMDVVFSDHTIVQPDVIYIGKERRSIVKQRIEGVPDLLIEILSDSNKRRDRVDKMNLYAEYGGTEYWIVDPAEKYFDFLCNRKGKYEVQRQQDDQYASPVIPGLSIHLAKFWAEVEQHVGDQSE